MPSNTPDITALRKDYDEKWDYYDVALQKALRAAEASVDHLRIESQIAYTTLVAACRSKI